MFVALAFATETFRNLIMKGSLIGLGWIETGPDSKAKNNSSCSQENAYLDQQRDINQLHPHAIHATGETS